MTLPLLCIGNGSISIAKSSYGDDHTCIIWYGEPTCWGEGMSLNERYAICRCALSLTIRCCSVGQHGQLGQGNTEYYAYLPDPIRLNSDFVPKEIVTGYKHSCALSFDGRVVCWGYAA